jgi:gluconate 2-dehydrogenase gamma chain
LATPALQALIPRHAAIVTAAAARIFPTTDTPGATEAGVVTYVVRTLAEAFPRLIPLYRAGCRALDRHAKAAHGAGFVRLAEAQQDAVLVDFEAGGVPWFRRAAEFFALLRKHTMEGVLGEPSYGGNQGLVGWRVVGFLGHQYGYADPYIDRKIDLEPVAVDRPYETEEAWHDHQV